MNRPVTPESVLSNDDPGDDIQRRFRYQNTYAAIISLSLLKENSKADCIFCEQHEDVLVKQKDDTFVGIQIKTRDSKKPYQASDEAIIKSLKRFIKLETQFQGKFSQYVIAVNNGFWQDRKNTNNLPYLLELAKSVIEEGIVPHKSISSFAQKICSNDKALSGVVLNSDEAISNLALSVLGKVTLDEKLPGLDDIHERLIKEISQLPNMTQRGYSNLDTIANSLINKMYQAGSLANNSSQPLDFYLLADSTEQRKNTIIQGKRITKENIQQILQEPSIIEASPCKKNKIDVLASNLSYGQEVDYTRLQNLLADEKWREADKETLAVMLKVSSREEEGCLSTEHIENFSCQDLHAIDQLWRKHSNERFGFSIQKRIWESVGGTPDANYTTFCRFGDRVGWRVRGRWLSYGKRTFNHLSPKGHLPFLCFPIPLERWDPLVLEIAEFSNFEHLENMRDFGINHLFSRAKKCRL
jgi:hypothetical protein